MYAASRKQLCRKVPVVWRIVKINAITLGVSAPRGSTEIVPSIVQCSRQQVLSVSRRSRADER